MRVAVVVWCRSTRTLYMNFWFLLSYFFSFVNLSYQWRYSLDLICIIRSMKSETSSPVNRDEFLFTYGCYPFLVVTFFLFYLFSWIEFATWRSLSISSRVQNISSFYIWTLLLIIHSTMSKDSSLKTLLFRNINVHFIRLNTF